MEFMSDLQEVMTCVICLDTLSPLVVQCHRGHALCQGCQQDQLRCPLCRKPFLDYKPTLLCKIAAIVGGQCKFRGCTYIRQGRKDDHQDWCGFRPTTCNLCNWSGYGKDVFSHVQDTHQATLVSNGSGNLAQAFGHCIRARQMCVPFSAFGLLFWLQFNILNLDWENQHSVLVLKVSLIPNGKINHDLQIVVGVKFKDCVYDARKKIQLKILNRQDHNLKNSVFIPALVLDDVDGMLKIDIVKDVAQTTNSTLDVYNKLKLNRVNELYRTCFRHLEEITGSEVILIISVLLCCVLYFLSLSN